MASGGSLRRENVYKHPLFVNLLKNPIKQDRRNKHQNLLFISSDKIYAWFEHNKSVLVSDITEIVAEKPKKVEEVKFQEPPEHLVDTILVDYSGKYAALIGEQNLTIGELDSSSPSRTFEVPLGVDEDIVDCKWHPDYDFLLVLLTTDNCIRFFDVHKHVFVRDYYLPPKSNEFPKSPKSPNVSQLLGNCGVHFTFSSGADDLTTIYVIYGNADVYSIKTSMKQQAADPVKGPLIILPRIEDEVFEEDAVGIQLISSNPDVLALIMSNGYVLHCVVLQAEEDEELIAIETVRLKDVIIDSSQSLNIISVSISNNSYIIRHNDGIYQLTVPWNFSLKDESFQNLPEEPTIAKALINTNIGKEKQYLYSCSFARHPIFGVHLFCLDSNFQLFIVTLLEKKSRKSFVAEKAKNQLKIEKTFEEHLREVLKRKENVPLFLSSEKDLDLEKKLELGAKALKIFENEYYKKQKLAILEIADKVKEIQSRFRQMEEIMEKLVKDTVRIKEFDANISEKIDLVNKKHLELNDRILSMSTSLQRIVEIPSKAEQKLQNDLQTLQIRLGQYRVKMDGLKEKLKINPMSTKMTKVQTKPKSVGLSPKQKKNIQSALLEDTDEIAKMAQSRKTLCRSKPIHMVGLKNNANAENEETKRIQTGHKLDSLNLLMFIFLLILTVITIWVFKHRRFRFIHETGLAIVYGLIVGAIIRYSSKNTEKKWADVSFIHQNQSDHYGPANHPDYLKLNLSKGGDEKLFTYKFDRIHTRGFEQKGCSVCQKATFDPEVFFNVMLPPIIFYAGYSMKRKHFFKNFGAITTFAFMGTIISCFAVGSILFGLTRVFMPNDMSLNNCLFFGAVISATDPVTVLAIFNDLNVDVDLYALVFGESVLNDAVAIVLSGTINKYNSTKEGFDFMAVLKSLGDFLKVFLGAFAIGSLIGCATALVTKFTKISQYPLLETSLFFLMSYSSFLAAEAADMTGIVAVLFCGICQAHYTYNNLSKESKSRTKELFDLLNFLMENFVFLYIGVSIFTFQDHKWDARYILASVAAIVIGRALNVYPLSFLLNLGRTNKIKYNFQHMMMFSGLRGAIAFALAIRNTSDDARKVMFSTTLVIVIATVISCGGLTTQMLLWLKIRVGMEEDTELQNFDSTRSTPPSEAPQNTEASLSPPRLQEKAKLVRGWYRIDAKVIKPFLTHATPPLTETLPKCCLPIAKFLTSEIQIAHFENRTRFYDSDTDLILDDADITVTDVAQLPAVDTITRPATLDIARPTDQTIPNITVNKPHPLFEANQENSSTLFTTRVNMGKEQGDHV
ncbi:DgyrCDS6110 [Dimorphilus gyrociliatus]|uniref:Sodium/hydrogen exchanger n=1 Tax=Dimorphilus gyrociliatus TaxID=2664684 RepID=A0A7I8VM66_9ANNE|nr:DgyrCDS6110 [Dimorphilus gyrociliatus]